MIRCLSFRVLHRLLTACAIAVSVLVLLPGQINHR